MDFSTVKLARSTLWVWTIVLCSCTISACSTPTLNKARSEFYHGDSTAALATLSDSKVVDSSDRLLYLLEKGLILHEVGDYDASTRELLAAAKYLDKYDYISLADETKAFLANDWAKRYLGEYSERLWIHSYLMMNFLSQGKYDSAAVEARRALERISKHGGVLENDKFSRSLIALSFEAAGQFNDAYIEYRKLADQMPDDPSLDSLLYRLAQRIGFAEDARLYKKRLQTAGEFEKLNNNAQVGEAIVFVSSGVIPRKFSSSLYTDYEERIAFPQYFVKYTSPPTIQALIDGKGCDCSAVGSDLGMLVSESLSERAAKLAAKSFARRFLKEAVSEAIEEKDELAGELIRVFFYALEQADTRSWQSLPRYMSVVRVPLDEKSAVVTLSLNEPNTKRMVLSIDKDAEPDVESTAKNGFAVPVTSAPLQFYKLRLTDKS